MDWQVDGVDGLALVVGFEHKPGASLAEHIPLLEFLFELGTGVGHEVERCFLTRRPDFCADGFHGGMEDACGGFGQSLPVFLGEFP